MENPLKNRSETETNNEHIENKIITNSNLILKHLSIVEKSLSNIETRCYYCYFFY